MSSCEEYRKQLVEACLGYIALCTAEHPPSALVVQELARVLESPDGGRLQELEDRVSDLESSLNIRDMD